MKPSAASLIVSIAPTSCCLYPEGRRRGPARHRGSPLTVLPETTDGLTLRRVGLSEAEIAERSGCPVERIEQLVGLGILVPHDEDCPFSAKDVPRVRLMQAFEDAGIDLDLIARGVASGKLSYENLGLYLPEPAALSQTGEGVAAEVRRSPELIAPPPARVRRRPAGAGRTAARGRG